MFAALSERLLSHGIVVGVDRFLVVTVVEVALPVLASLRLKQQLNGKATKTPCNLFTAKTADGHSRCRKQADLWHYISRNLLRGTGDFEAVYR